MPRPLGIILGTTGWRFQVKPEFPFLPIDLCRQLVESPWEVAMKTHRIVLAGLLTLCGTVAACLPARLQAQTNSDIAKNAFEVTVTVNINNFVYTPVAIPAGKRLVVQNVNLSGAATTSGAYVVPIVILSSTIGSGTANLSYFSPNPYVTDPSQFYEDKQTTVYADTLQVAPAFAGFTPTFMEFNVVITGYLVDLPAAPK